MRAWLFVLLIFSCSKSPIAVNEKTGYFIVGINWGECALPCGYSYLLLDDQAYQNKNKKQFITNHALAQWEKLSDKDYYQLLKIKDSIPPSFISNSDGQIGDNHNHRDGANIFIEWELNNKVRRWGLEAFSKFDTNSPLSKEYREYSVMIQRILEEVR